jgi:hypothetical protein
MENVLNPGKIESHRSQIPVFTGKAANRVAFLL